MPVYLSKLNADPTGWLLEEDPDNPGVRYYALKWLKGLDEQDEVVVEARTQVMQSGPVPRILEQQEKDGYWTRSDSLYFGGMKSTASQLHILANLGADGSEPRIRQACDLLLTKNSTPSGGFSHTDTQSGVIHCLNGNMLRALMLFGYEADDRLKMAVDWAAKSVTGTGDPNYFKSGTTGPMFACTYNGSLPCAWGAVKELRAFAMIPPRRRTKTVKEAIESGVEFLLSHDLVQADFPTDSTESKWWWNFGFPTAYQTDLLELLLAVTELNRIKDKRAQSGIEFVLSRQDELGRWTMEQSFNGRMFTPIERKGRPSKWLTLRAMKVISAASDN